METLPEVQKVYRIRIVTTFLQSGIPISTVNLFHELLEEHAFRLPDRRGLYDLILSEELSKIKAEIVGKHTYLCYL